VVSAGCSRRQGLWRDLEPAPPGEWSCTASRGGRRSRWRRWIRWTWQGSAAAVEDSPLRANIIIVIIVVSIHQCEVFPITQPTVSELFSHWLTSYYAARWQRHNGVNSLLRAVMQTQSQLNYDTQPAAPPDHPLSDSYLAFYAFIKVRHPTHCTTKPPTQRQLFSILCCC